MTAIERRQRHMVVPLKVPRQGYFLFRQVGSLHRLWLPSLMS